MAGEVGAEVEVEAGVGFATCGAGNNKETGSAVSDGAQMAEIGLVHLS